MAVRDQFLTAPAIAYSGSYQDAVFWKGSSIFSRGIGRFDDEQEEIKFDRYVIASKSSRKVVVDIVVGGTQSHNIVQFLASDAIKILNKASIGKSYPFFKHKSQNEQYHDSFGPSIPESILAGNGNLVQQELKKGTTFKYGYPAIEESGSFDVTITNITASVEDRTHFGNTRIADNIWVNSFPFENRYRKISRPLKPSVFYPKSYDLSVGRGDTAGFGDESPENTNYYNLPLTTSRNRINTIYWYGDTFFKALREEFNAVDKLTNEELPPLISNLNEVFYGIGELKPSNLPAILSFPEDNIVEGTSFNLPSSVGVRLRGVKYGMLNPNPLYSDAVFRFDHYGQFRDMLEPRLYSKFYDSVGIRQDGVFAGQPSVLAAAVNVRFVSGSDAAVTASNPITLNPTVSGLYDFEAKSGKPFDDAR